MREFHRQLFVAWLKGIARRFSRASRFFYLKFKQRLLRAGRQTMRWWRKRAWPGVKRFLEKRWELIAVRWRNRVVWSRTSITLSLLFLVGVWVIARSALPEIGWEPLLHVMKWIGIGVIFLLPLALIAWSKSRDKESGEKKSGYDRWSDEIAAVIAVVIVNTLLAFVWPEFHRMLRGHTLGFWGMNLAFAISIVYLASKRGQKEMAGSIMLALALVAIPILILRAFGVEMDPLKWSFRWSDKSAEAMGLPPQVGGRVVSLTEKLPISPWRFFDGPDRDSVLTFFQGDTLMANISACESGFRQFEDDARKQVLRGRINPKDLGAFQINESIWGDSAKAMGMDITNLKGNLEFAEFLREQEGLSPWNASRTCWEQGMRPGSAPTRQIQLAGGALVLDKVLWVAPAGRWSSHMKVPPGYRFEVVFDENSETQPYLVLANVVDYEGNVGELAIERLPGVPLDLHREYGVRAVTGLRVQAHKSDSLLLRFSRMKM